MSGGQSGTPGAGGRLGAGAAAAEHSAGQAAAAGSAGQDWLAPCADAPIDAVVTLPGSKSITNRALVLAALADGPSLIRRPLHARDTLLMVAALRALGAEVGAPADSAETASWLVVPAFGGAAAPSARGATAQGAQRRGTHGCDTATVDVGNAGTVLRFVPPVAVLATRDVRFDGDPRARERPVGPLLAALRDLGAEIDDDGRAALPFTVLGHGGLPGGAVTLDASGSSQLVSALLLAGARFGKGVEIRHQGPPVPSIPHIELTIQMLREAGVQAEAAGGACWRVLPGPVRSRAVDVEPDLSNAAPFLAAALVTGGSVTIADWPARTAQPGDALRDLLTGMGGSCEMTSGGLTVRGSGTIHGITADLRDVSELVPVLAALAALASSPSRFTGITHMRTHEADRLAALASEINAIGGDVAELPDGLAISPRRLRSDRAAGPAGDGRTGAGGHVFATYDDHRLVMAAAVLGLAVPGLRVANPATVAKTLPSFTRLWTAMLERAP